MRTLVVTVVVLLPLLVIAGIVVRLLKNQGPSSWSLEQCVTRLEDSDYDVRDQAVSELVRRGREAPETVIPVLLTRMRAQAREIFKGRLPPEVPPIGLYVVVEPPVEGESDPLWPGDAASYEAYVEACLKGKPPRAPDPRLHAAVPRLPEPEPADEPGTAPAGGDGAPAEAPRRVYVLERPRLPIGVWVFGVSTILGGGSQVILDVQKQVRDDYLEFARRHAGRTLAFAAGNEVLALYVLDHPEAERIRLEPFTPDEQGRMGLARVAAQIVTSFHDGYTEAGRVLARLGPGVPAALEGLATQGAEEARVAAWAWWRMESDADRGRTPQPAEGANAPGTR